jgi:hypothetical protein
MSESRSMRLLTWVCGVPLASLRYLHRRSEVDATERDVPSTTTSWTQIRPPGVDRARHGVGPLYRRRYRIGIDAPKISAETLVDIVAADPNVASPTEVAVFEKTAGAPGGMAVGDEYLIRMPGPWNGPVQVIERERGSFRLATRPGHLEAGTIEFRACSDDDGRLVAFEIESWARSANRWQDVLYRRVGIAKAIQESMWAAFLERIQQVSGGSRQGPIRVITERETP